MNPNSKRLYGTWPADRRTIKVDPPRRGRAKVGQKPTNHVGSEAQIGAVRSKP